MLLHISIFANLFLQPFYDRPNSFKLTRHFIATVPLYPFPLPFPLSLRVKTFDLPFNLSPVFSTSDLRDSFSFLSAYLPSWFIPFVPSRNLIPIFLPPSVFVASFFNIVHSARPFIVCSIEGSIDFQPMSRPLFRLFLSDIDGIEFDTYPSENPN